MTKVELADLRESWRERIAQFRASGLSGAAWCTAHQVKEHQLWYWASKFPAEPTLESHPRFVPVQIHEPGNKTESPLLVRIGSVVIEVRAGYDPDLLRGVVNTLST